MNRPAYPPGAARLVYLAIAAMFVVPLVAALGAMLIGCGAGALQTHAQAADAMGSVANATTGELETAYERGQLESVISACGTDDPAEAKEPCQTQATENVETVREHWAPVWSAHETLEEVHEAWRETLQLAAAGDLDDPGRWARLAARVVDVYRALVMAAETVDVRLPPVPGLLQQAAALASGGGS